MTDIRAEEYWAKKGDVNLFVFRKRQAEATGQPVLFLVHGSSFCGPTGFDLQVLHMVEGCFVGFRFVADHCTPDAISGFVELGAASSHARGPTTLGQFGRLPFSGKST